MLRINTALLWSYALMQAAAYSRLSDQSLQILAAEYRDLSPSSNLLGPILVPRIPGSQGSFQVQEHFIDFFERNVTNWHVQLDKFEAMTPKGSWNFTNIIMSRDPPWITDDEKGNVGRVTFAAHYDSKIEPEGFIGAIDSAAPCSLLLYIVQVLDAALNAKWDASNSELDDATGFEVVFFDGEEAFSFWTAQDSIYGARLRTFEKCAKYRHLANVWDTKYYRPFSSRRTRLASIDLLVLLDLLGSVNPRIPSYYPTTHWAYLKLQDLEKRIREGGLASIRDQQWFYEEHGSFRGGFIGDDHLPFVERGVEVLHLIPSVFPPVWHEMDDDGDHLDKDTLADWGLLLSAFVAEWLELDGFLGSKPARQEL